MGDPPFDQSNISTLYLYFYSSKTNFYSTDSASSDISFRTPFPMTTSGHWQNHETHHGTVSAHFLAAVFWFTCAGSMAVETLAHDWEFDRFDDGSQSEYRNKCDALTLAVGANS